MDSNLQKAWNVCSEGSLESWRPEACLPNLYTAWEAGKLLFPELGYGLEPYVSMRYGWLDRF